MEEARKSGYQFGAALRAVFGAPASGSTGAVMLLAMQFAEWSGYREFKTGGAFVAGFTQGLTGEDVSETTMPRLDQSKG